MLKDYFGSKLTINQALIEQKKKGIISDFIIWNGLEIYNSYKIQVPTYGKITAEFLSNPGNGLNGFDMKVHGYFRLKDSNKIPVLRTWNDPKYESIVSYEFFSEDRLLYIWNVYKFSLANGDTIESKWTDNSSFWVEKINEYEYIFHCSKGDLSIPDFTSLVFKTTINSI